MTKGERIKLLREKANMTQEELASTLQVQTFSGYAIVSFGCLLHT